VDPARPYHLTSARTVLVCAAFDGLTAEEHEKFTPGFSPAAFLTSAEEKELSATGINHERVGFPYAPSFDGIQKALATGSLATNGALVLAGEINHIPSNHVISCDFRLYSQHGDLLFTKRCLCIDELGASGWLFAPRMVMQQLFGDPDFQRAIQ
jgi:hypothetical protein